MFPNTEGKYAPAKDRFVSFLKKYPYFCDED
jgi:TolA-binding protein